MNGHHVQFLRIKKLTGKSIITLAAKHNLRELQAELGADSHIEHQRIKLNRVLAGPGSAEGVAMVAQSLMDEAGIKALRKDAVRGLEIIFSLPPKSGIQEADFFSEALIWAGQYFAAPVISAVVHNDEAAPHCHVLILPLINGRMVGSDLMGNKPKLKTLQADFHAQVARRYGLERQHQAKRLSATVRRRVAEQVLLAIEAKPSCIFGPGVKSVLLDLFAQDPEPIMQALGIPMPVTVDRKKTFVGIMTKPCKPETTLIGFGGSKHIGFNKVSAPEKLPTLSCVGFDSPVPLASPQGEPTDDRRGFIRIRDEDNQSSCWDEATGEFHSRVAG
jgi:hypothetical protein